YQSSVDANVGQREVAHVLHDARLFNAVERAVRDADVRDRRSLVAFEQQRVLALLARHAADLDVAQHRRERAGVPFLVVEVGGDDRFSDLADGDVAHRDALDDAAALGVGLEPQHAIETRTVHPAPFSEDVPRAARDLAADHDAAVAVTHLAVADDDVLDRLV